VVLTKREWARWSWGIVLQVLWCTIILYAKKIILAASFNIYRNLRYYNGRGKDVSCFMEQIEQYRRQIPKVETIAGLMGLREILEGLTMMHGRSLSIRTWSLINV